MEFERDGAFRIEGALSDEACRGIEHILSDLPLDRPGIRLRGNAPLRRLLEADGAVGRHAACVLEGCRPVRSILFDKSRASNWSLGWHQDRTIAVAERVDAPGFLSWNRKGG